VITDLFGALLGALALAPKRQAPAAPMSISEATARSAWLAGRLMECFGEGGTYECRPVGISQFDQPYLIVHPVTACWDHQCHLVSR